MKVFFAMEVRDLIWISYRYLLSLGIMSKLAGLWICVSLDWVDSLVLLFSSKSKHPYRFIKQTCDIIIEEWPRYEM